MSSVKLPGKHLRNAFFPLDFILLVSTYLIVEPPKMMVDLASTRRSPTVNQPVLSGSLRNHDGDADDNVD